MGFKSRKAENSIYNDNKEFFHFHPDNLIPICHKENHAIFMLSSNFQKILSGPNLEAAWHDVIQVDNSFIGKAYERWALVAFIDACDVEALPREETHKWYIPSESSR